MLTSSNWRAFSGAPAGERGADDGECHLPGIAAQQDRDLSPHPAPQLTTLFQYLQQCLDAAVEQHHVRGQPRDPTMPLHEEYGVGMIVLRQMRAAKSGCSMAGRLNQS
jgi:hypothetical protein